MTINLPHQIFKTSRSGRTFGVALYTLRCLKHKVFRPSYAPINVKPYPPSTGRVGIWWGFDLINLPTLELKWEIKSPSYPHMLR